MAEIEAARERIAGIAVRTPLVRLYLDEAPAEIWLKLESLQPIGSFKLRGAANAVLSAPREEIARGLVTTSAGNMAQGVAWMARRLGVPATIVVPEHAAPSKLAAVERLGGRVVRVSWDEWWAAMEAGGAEGVEGYFVHPVRDEPVMAGNGTIGLELLEQLDRFDAVLVPWGGGGLTTGIASALKALRPETEVYVCEPTTGAPVSAALANGGVPVRVEYTPSFVDGAGAGALLPEMWERARPLVADAFAISPADAAAAVRLLLERARIVAEGAAALPVAAALSGRAGGGRLVCIVSGGNIDASRLAAILEGKVPD
ncbi:MAG TPA: pyridoxal-phosphate dependent enzyme [Gaiellaceae bacterium]|nr:pyridoxal-phosphate dependent enzyme [Gaiellaceae bacterium]